MSEVLETERNKLEKLLQEELSKLEEKHKVFLKSTGNL